MDDGPRRARFLRKALFATEHAPIRASQHLLHGTYQPHDHDFVEVALIVGGHGLHRSVYGMQQIGAGDAFILRPGAWHAYHDCQQLAVWNCCFGIELLQRELSWMRKDPLLEYLFWSGLLSLGRQGLLAVRLSAATLSACQPHLAALRQIGQDESIRARAEQLGHLLVFFGQLARGVDPEHYPGGRRPARPHRAVLAAVRLLEAQPARSWSLPDLAEQVHVDPSYLVRLFKASTGLSPMAYLARHRAECAAALLLRTDLPVARIGEKVGWPDPTYFARRFRAHFGLSATNYRAKLTTPAAGGSASATPLLPLPP